MARRPVAGPLWLLQAHSSPPPEAPRPPACAMPCLHCGQLRGAVAGPARAPGLCESGAPDWQAQQARGGGPARRNVIAAAARVANTAATTPGPGPGACGVREHTTPAPAPRRALRPLLCTTAAQQAYACRCAPRTVTRTRAYRRLPVGPLKRGVPFLGPNPAPLIRPSRKGLRVKAPAVPWCAWQLQRQLHPCGAGGR